MLNSVLSVPTGKGISEFLPILGVCASVILPILIMLIGLKATEGESINNKNNVLFQDSYIFVAILMLFFSILMVMLNDFYNLKLSLEVLLIFTVIFILISAFKAMMITLNEDLYKKLDFTILKERVQNRMHSLLSIMKKEEKLELEIQKINDSFKEKGMPVKLKFGTDRIDQRSKTIKIPVEHSGIIENYDLSYLSRTLHLLLYELTISW